MTGDANKPKRWWQWVLMYPTVAVALVGLVPGSFELWRVIQTGGEVPIFQTKDAVVQMELWEKNANCLTTVEMIEVKATDAVIVGARICPSGDIQISGRFPGSLPKFRWIALRHVIQAETVSLSLFPEAVASEYYLDQQAGGKVLCQKWVGNGLLLQRIYWAPTNSCYDNVINTYNGVMVSSHPAPCSPQC